MSPFQARDRVLISQSRAAITPFPTDELDSINRVAYDRLEDQLNFCETFHIKTLDAGCVRDVVHRGERTRRCD